jgi:citrate synthase
MNIEANGLEDVVAATTRLSDVDGEAGRLVIAGRAVEDLAGRRRFEEVFHLLWRGHEPSPAEHEHVRALLAEGRELGHERLGDLGDALAMPDAMEALRGAAAHLDESSLFGRVMEYHAARPHENRSEGDRADTFVAAARLVGALATFAAAWNQKAPTRPDPSASQAADLLRMMTGRTPTQHDVDALDAYLVTVIDHGMNASTFTARVVASTGSDMVSAVVAAIGALKGKLHGGAPGPVLDMLDAIGDAGSARAWLEATLARGERIMGMGHRIYRVRDPRAFVLERAIARLEEARSAPSATSARLALARAVEHEAETLLAARHPNRALRANVEFYTAVLLEAIGIPRALFTTTFAVARAAGWCAHVEEQRRIGRLIRPRSRYVDAAPL